MATIVEYQLDPQDKPRSFHPKTIPSWITDGGYWQNPDNHTMIGEQAEGSTLPDTATILTLEELQARQRAIHADYPMRRYPGEEKNKGSLSDYLTDDEVNNLVKEWWDAR